MKRAFSASNSRMPSSPHCLSSTSSRMPSSTSSPRTFRRMASSSPTRSRFAISDARWCCRDISTLASSMATGPPICGCSLPAELRCAAKFFEIVATSGMLGGLALTYLVVPINLSARAAVPPPPAASAATACDAARISAFEANDVVEPEEPPAAGSLPMGACHMRSWEQIDESSPQFASISQWPIGASRDTNFLYRPLGSTPKFSRYCVV
mmetsp:Transcript_47650/g.137141  ORF Transcript_47650/g.137141 Transcript_47650/m.137141 type:complete len:210 (+) Transcript_47650:1293-1922(+)